MIDNKRGMAPILVFLIIGIIISIIFSIAIISSTNFRLFAIGSTLIILTIIYGFKSNFKSNTGKVMITLAIIGVILVLIPSIGILQTQITTGNYIQAPSFYYYECSPASKPLESNHQLITTGEVSKISCPINTDSCNLYIKQIEKLSFSSMYRRISYQICHNDGSCDPLITTPTSVGSSQIQVISITNLLNTDYVKIKYQSSITGLGWENKINGAEWYTTYRPFILWKVDTFGGGKTEYSTIEQGCKFQSKEVLNLISSITNLNKEIKNQTSLSNDYLDFYKTRNFIGSYIPISSSNINFVNYNGQEGYCLNRQIFAISKLETNGNVYKIVDSNFNTRLSNSVTCCPGETQPNQKCNSNFNWENLEQSQCSPFKACAGADWMPYTQKNLIRYNCINNKCVSEIKSVECTSDNDCGNYKTCDTKLYKCIDISSGTINGDKTTTLKCKFYQEPYITTQKDYGILYFRALINKPIITQTPSCKTAGWIWILVIFSSIILLGIYLIKLWNPTNKRK